MSFIRPRSARLAERSASMRRELAGFLLSVTVWGVLVGLLGNTTFALLSGFCAEWAKRHAAMAVLLAVVVFGVLVHGFVLALAHTMTAAMAETRRFNLVVPLLYTDTDMDVVGVEGYEALRQIRAQFRKLRPEDWGDAVVRAVAESPGRPLGGRVHQAVGEAIAAALLDSTCKWCEFYLSENAQFHGVDYRVLANPPGPCPKVDVAGAAGVSIHLPAGCTVDVRQTASDQFGRRTRAIQIRGGFGEVSVRFFPQWAVLGPYHGLSLKFAKARLQTNVQGIADHAPAKRPSLFVVEIPVDLRVIFRNRINPWFFVTPQFEITTLWLSDLLESMEESLSWDCFVDREYLRQTVREELERAQPESACHGCTPNDGLSEA